MNVRDTSKQSFGQIEPELSRQERELVNELKKGGRRCWSLREARAAYPAFDIRTTSRIVYDLKKKGAMFELRERLCTITGRMINAVALRCFYVEEFEVQRRERFERFSSAARSVDEAACRCACCERWRERFKAEAEQARRAANPA